MDNKCTDSISWKYKNRTHFFSSHPILHSFRISVVVISSYFVSFFIARGRQPLVFCAVNTIIILSASNFQIGNSLLHQNLNRQFLHVVFVAPSKKSQQNQGNVVDEKTEQRKSLALRHWRKSVISSKDVVAESMLKKQNFWFQISTYFAANQ